MKNTIGTLVRVVDDDPTVCDSLTLYLSSRGYRTKSYSCGQAFLEEDTLSIPGCIILDVRMPGMSGLELFHILKAKNVSLPVVFLSAHGDIAMAVSAVQNGAFTFIEKPPMPAKLAEIVEQAVAESLRRERIEQEKAGCLRIWNTLTASEKQAAVIIAKGLKNQELADVLGISLWTAKSYRSAVYSKLQADNAVDVADFLRETGLTL